MGKTMNTVAVQLVPLITLLVIAGFLSACRFGWAASIGLALGLIVGVCMLNAALHQGANLLTSRLMGLESPQLQWIPRFWEGQWKAACVRPPGLTSNQALVGSLAPYLLDAALLALAAIVLPQTRHSALSVVLFAVLVAKPVLNLTTNAAGFYLSTGDFHLVASRWGEAVGTAVVLNFVGMAFATSWHVTWARLAAAPAA